MHFFVPMKPLFCWESFGVFSSAGTSVSASGGFGACRVATSGAVTLQISAPWPTQAENGKRFGRRKGFWSTNPPPKRDLW